jgi:hypothetical protein
MRREHRNRNVGGLCAEHRAEQKVDGQHGIGRSVADLVPDVGPIIGRGIRHGTAKPVGQVVEVGGIRGTSGRRAAPGREIEFGRRDFVAHCRVCHDPDAMPAPPQLAACGQQRIEIAESAPGYEQKIV